MATAVASVCSEATLSLEEAFKMSRLKEYVEGVFLRKGVDVHPPAEKLAQMEGVKYYGYAMEVLLGPEADHSGSLSLFVV